MTIPAAVREALDLFLPRGCLACGSRIPPEDALGLVCAPCRVRLRPPPSPFCPRCQSPKGTGHAPGEICLECQDWPSALASARAAVILDPTAGALIHALKYRGWRNIASFMGQKIPRDGVSLLPGVLVIPVPTTSWRRRTRGYNQAAVLAQAVARLWGLPLVEALRRRAGRTQVRLSPRERAENVRGAFHLPERFRSQIRERDVILVDDVLTTGATARAAAEALESGGVRSIHLRSFARALPYSLR